MEPTTRILLVYPEMPAKFYSQKYWNKIIGQKAELPPLGLLTVSALLPKEWERKLIDLNVKPLLDEHIQWADYVFLSAMNIQEESVREVIAQCKKNNATIVAGGPLFTYEHDRFKEVDHFVLNEAEITLPVFLRDLAEGKPLPLYKSKEAADITVSPKPDLDLIDMNDYRAGILQYSRGCPYLCDFCDIPALYGRNPRVKTTEQIIAELDAFHENSNVQGVLFADDNLIGNKKILKAELLPALIKWRRERNPRFSFATELSVNLADDDELMQLLLDAGFRSIFMGIETSQEDTLKASHKNQNLKRNILENVHLLLEKGFKVKAGFIVGFDTDTEASFTNQINFIQASGIPMAMVNMLKAPPGTELFERMKRENRLSGRMTFDEGSTNIVPLMGHEALNKGFKKVIDNIYPYKHSYKRLKAYFMHHRLPDTSLPIKTPRSLSQYGLILKIIFQLGIINRNRYYFWKLICWTAFYKSNFFVESVFYGIYMYQLDEYYKTLSAQLEAQLLEESRAA